MNKEAASAEADLINRANGNKWCPLSGQFCKKECVVYIKARAVKLHDHTYLVEKGYCNAYSLIGP